MCRKTNGQSLIKENCHNSRTNDDTDMKLGPVTKLDKRNKTTSKKKDDDIMSRIMKYSLNAQFSIYFIAPFVVKPKGCNKCVMFFDTMTRSIFSSSSFALTKSVSCVLNASHKSKHFCETLGPNFFSHL